LCGVACALCGVACAVAWHLIRGTLVDVKHAFFNRELFKMIGVYNNLQLLRFLNTRFCSTKVGTVSSNQEARETERETI
jgi:hypothetical protein